ncbi:MAG: Lysophospholipase and related esterase, partial [Clostridia bacterium]|nr:Lysophospholipase and related esterase [Clostridia bacterium]
MFHKDMLEKTLIRAIFIFISVFIFFNILQNTGDFLFAKTELVAEEAEPVISITPEENLNIPTPTTDNNIDNTEEIPEDNSEEIDNDNSENNETTDVADTEAVTQENSEVISDETNEAENTVIEKLENDYTVDITPVKDSDKQIILNNINDLPLSQFSLDNYSDLYENIILKEIEPVPSVYLEDLYMIGDSITKGLWEYELFPKERIYAEIAVNTYSISRYPIVETAPNVKIKVTEALKQTKPHKVIITLGTNEVSWMTPKQFIGYYSKFIDQIFEVTPDTTIILQSITPIKKDEETIDFNNRKINYFNF